MKSSFSSAILLSVSLSCSSAFASDFAVSGSLVVLDPIPSLFNGTWLQHSDFRASGNFNSAEFGSFGLGLNWKQGDQFFQFNYNYAASGSAIQFGLLAPFDDNAATFASLEAGYTHTFPTGESLSLQANGDPAANYSLILSTVIPSIGFSQDYSLTRDQDAMWSIDAIFRMTNPALPMSTLEFNGVFEDNTTVNATFDAPPSAGAFKNVYSTSYAHKYQQESSAISFNATPVPAPLPIFGIGVALPFVKRLKHRSQQLRILEKRRY